MLSDFILIQKTYEYVLNVTEIGRISQIKDLGVILDTVLYFKHHVNYVVEKASGVLGFRQ